MGRQKAIEKSENRSIKLKAEDLEPELLMCFGGEYPEHKNAQHYGARQIIIF